MFNVPLASPYTLQRPPLVQAMAQVQFPLTAQFQTLAGIDPVERGLEDVLPYMEQLPAPGSSVLWRFSNGGDWSLLLEPTSATLSVGSDYSGIDHFSQRFAEVLTVLANVGRFRRCERLAVRYINLLDIPPVQEQMWITWFRSELTGWSGAGLLGSGTELDADITRSQFRATPTGPFAGLPGDIHSIIQYGLLPPGTQVDIGSWASLEQKAFVLDLDIFVQENQEFTTSLLVRQLRILHTQIDSFFRWSLTDEGAAHFGVEDL